MTVLTSPAPSLTSGKLPKWAPWALLLASFAISYAVFAVTSIGEDLVDFNIVGASIVGILLYMVLITVISAIAESRRKAVDRLMTALVATAFLIALMPLVSLLWTVAVNGIHRFDAEFFSFSMRNIVGEGGGIVHAIWGTVLVTLTAAVISVPIGLMTSIYLVEYGRGKLAKGITFFVDVMTGIPSIVAGLFIYAVFSLLIRPGISMGIMGALALAVLMTPVVVRGSEELLRIVPNELREAAYALGVPKWLTILKVVLPTSIAGIMTSVMLSISRVIGETAPLLLTAGFTLSMNTNIFNGQMMTLPVFAYNQYMNQGTNPEAALDRAWASALTLILIVMVLNLLARLIAKWFAPKTSGR
ncbi:phosphate ABC transporter permease PstA [Microbacterium aerolatum]|uniref:Phosphate transport system permease protein PstA n=1 Tax=Microbacterium aerolatum TaxID=153731 RepID=A0A511AIN9_9MICO|nr:phosphate ABC transporter permease PstA [Microbacterium aerolatum]GEK87193.1 phosphate transport system permease protein PstA [Microbacterium aerolatum]GGB34938.1 phosphate transport system permease protein PstA [Microbacterium aerolatum]